MDGAAEKAYSAWPSRVYLVGRDGRVAFDSRLGEQDFRAADFEAAIREILSGRGTHGRVAVKLGPLTAGAGWLRSA